MPPVGKGFTVSPDHLCLILVLNNKAALVRLKVLNNCEPLMIIDTRPFVVVNLGIMKCNAL